MKFWLVVLGLLRRRRVATVVATTSLAVAALLLFLVPAHYTSTATLVLTTSPTNQASTEGDPNQQPSINPLLNFNEGLNTAGAILVQTLNTDEALRRLGADGGSTAVTISSSGGAQQLGVNGPFLYISGDSTASPAEAKDVVSRAKNLASDVLRERQEELKAPPNQLIGLLYVVQPTEPVADRGDAYKAAGTGLVFALAISLGIFYYRDVVRGGRGQVAAVPQAVVPTLGPDPLPASVESTPSHPDPQSDGSDTPAVLPAPVLLAPVVPVVVPAPATAPASETAEQPAAAPRRARPRPALRRPAGADDTRNDGRPVATIDTLSPPDDQPRSATGDPAEGPAPSPDTPSPDAPPPADSPATDGHGE